MNQFRTYGRRDEQERQVGDAAFLGVNVRLSPDKLPPGFLADSENNRMSDGDVTPRKGLVRPGWLNATDASAGVQIRGVDAFYGSGVFKDPDSFEWVLLAADGGIFRCKESNARFAMSLPTGVRILSGVTFTQAFNKVFCFRGRYLAPLVLRSLDDGWEDLVQRWSSSATYDAAIVALDQLAEEIAYGPFRTIATEVTLSAGELTSASTTATVTHAGHGYSTGDVITISGATQTEYNGTYTITVSSSSVFTYTFAGSGTSPATGTIKMVKSGVSSSGDLVTVVTPVEHGYVTGADITITGATQTEYNGRWNITVVDANTFTYQFTGSSAATATGTIQYSDMSNYWKALGSQVTLTSITRVSQTATATKNSHGFSNGQYVTIAGATQTEYNGTFAISNVTANTFDYTVTGAPATPATGTITAQTSIVLAGQSPDTNPEAWTRRYDILPNADDALFINNRLLVPTAYTPGDDGYDSTSTWTKKDFIVATDALDELHFDFINEFRINQGDDSEIVQLLKYDNNTVIVFKGKTWGILSNIRVDLDNVTLDMRNPGYGLCARGAAVVAGKDVYFVASNRGVVSLAQTEQGLLQSRDIPFSNDIEPWIRRINWNLKHLIRLAWWDNKLFVSVPMDDCQVLNRAPDAPEVTIALTENGLTLTWPEVDTATSYTVYQVVFGNYIFETSTTGTSWGPADPGNVSYVVTALNALGESVYSNQVTTVPP